MLHGPIWNKLPQYALPVAATGILGQLFNASDLAIVGNFTGTHKTLAVAAVGANSPVIGLILNFFIGIALGANVVIAHAVGREDNETIHRAVTFKAFSKYLTASQSNQALAMRTLATDCFVGGDKELIDDDSLFLFGLMGQLGQIIQMRNGTLVNLSKPGK